MKPLNNIELILQAVYRKEKNYIDGAKELNEIIDRRMLWFVGIVGLLGIYSVITTIIILFRVFNCQ